MASSLLDNKQMSNWLGVKHHNFERWKVDLRFISSKILPVVLHDLIIGNMFVGQIGY